MEDPSEEWNSMEDVNKNAPEESENTAEDVGEIVEQQPSDTVQSGQSKNGGTTSKSKSGQNKNRNKKDKSDDKGDNGQKQVSLIVLLYQLPCTFCTVIVLCIIDEVFCFATPKQLSYIYIQLSIVITVAVINSIVLFPSI